VSISCRSPGVEILSDKGARLRKVRPTRFMPGVEPIEGAAKIACGKHSGHSPGLSKACFHGLSALSTPQLGSSRRGVRVPREKLVIFAAAQALLCALQKGEVILKS
jgi:hypothetical protein